MAFCLIALLAMGLQPLLDPESWRFSWPSTALASELAPNSEEARFFKFSKQGDALIVLLDTVQSDVFAQVLQEHPEYREALTGFTYFWNNVGRAPTTLMSMIPIYSGKPYEGGSVTARYNDLRKDSLFSDFEAHGYGSSLAGISIIGCPAQHCISTSKLIRLEKFQVDLSNYLEVLELGLLRIFPTFVHERWYNDDRGRLRTALSTVPASKAAKSLAALSSIARYLEPTDADRSLKVLHLMGAHPPIALDGGCNEVNVSGKSREDYEDLVRCNVRTFVDLVAALKEAGVYDQMTIVLLADHGETTGEPEEELEPILGKVPPLWGRLARFEPLLAIKLPNRTGPFQIDDAPTQNSDLRATLCAEVLRDCGGGILGENVFALEDDAARQRHFIDFLLWQTDHRRLDGMPEEAYEEFTVTGLLRDADYDSSALPPREKFK
ncbi:sulfatase-like hydrolase/transferase [Methyloligella halotolerans]|uniref:sulfatase-like hydrolase/transferase n=1 Tax=Methyloligella halotolerans TaxID=1177755 RepID=UPI00147115A1|nr:sulfatase-like hydrolase/transferase [Methyloligella halotolerans]